MTQDSLYNDIVSDDAQHEVITRKDALRIFLYYQEHIRPHTEREKLGSLKQLQTTFSKGATLEQVWTAVKNYERDPLRMKCKDVSYIKTMRSFFNYNNILEWQKPRELPQKPAEPALELLTKLNDLSSLPDRKPTDTQASFAVRKDTQPTVDDEEFRTL